MSRTSDNMVLTSQLKNADSGGQFEAVKSELRTGRCEINSKDSVCMCMYIVYILMYMQYIHTVVLKTKR